MNEWATKENTEMQAFPDAKNRATLVETAHMISKSWEAKRQHWKDSNKSLAMPETNEEWKREVILDTNDWDKTDERTASQTAFKMKKQVHWRDWNACFDQLFKWANSQTAAAVIIESTMRVLKLAFWSWKDSFIPWFKMQQNGTQKWMHNKVFGSSHWKQLHWLKVLISRWLQPANR